MLRNPFKRPTSPRPSDYELGYNEGRYGGWTNPPFTATNLFSEEYLKGFYRGKSRRTV